MSNLRRWKLRNVLRHIAFHPTERQVHIRVIRSYLPTAEGRDFRGGPVESFWAYDFFRLYLEAPERGRAGFRNWYWERFVDQQGWRVPKGAGGLAGGSLQRTIEAVHIQRYGESPDCPADAPAPIIAEAIDRRVRYHFSILESIRDRGFDTRLGPPISAIQSDDLFYVLGGHHRTAALAVLGHSVVPLTVVNRLRLLRRPSHTVWEWIA